MANNNSTVPVSNAASVVGNLQNDWQGLFAAGLILGIGGYALYRLIKW